jgi:CDP-diacylglycerol--glycerol-3-phosphate 3-phosphatidyltransferase
MLANTITIFRTFLIVPLFALLAFGQERAWAFALVLFWSAGALDMLDGMVARKLKQTSDFGAMMDVVGDRLLTFAAVIGLVVGGGLAGVHAIAGVILVARDLIVASLNEALPGKIGPRVSNLERAKIASAFAALTILITEPLTMFEHQLEVGYAVLWVAAALTCITVAQYWMRGLREFKES